MRKALYTLALICVAASYTQAQHINSDVDIEYYYKCHKGHYIKADGGVMRNGHQIYNYNKEYWAAKFGIGYQYFITPHIGLGIGAGYHKLQIDSLPVGNMNYNIDDAIDMMGNQYQQRVFFSNFGENTDIYKLSMPIGVYFQGSLSLRWKIMAGIGGILSTTNKAGYHTYGSIETQAYYESKDLLLTEEDVKGYPNIMKTSQSQDGEYKHLNSLSAFGELSLLFAINPLIDLYIGGRIEYLSSTTAQKDGTPIYDTDSHSQDGYANMKYNGLLNTAEVEMEKMMPSLMAGVRFRFGEMPDIQKGGLNQTRHIKRTQEFQMERQHRFDRKNRKYDNQENDEQKVDSVELAMEERRRREIQRLEMERRQREKDSLEAIAQNAPDPELDKISENIYAEIDQLLKNLEESISWGFNESDLSDNSSQKKGIDRLCQIMKEHPEIIITVTGHTCNIGTVEQNKKVGLRRAESFKAILTSRGVPEGQIKCVTKWFSEPLVPNTSEANRAKNRRIEIKR
ncbi:MAG: OmpA family protein [Bacteroidales bacterium]|nr:OmpA family protein [Bacteroidales bacterium]